MQQFLDAYLETERAPRKTRSHLLSQLLARFPTMAHIPFDDLLFLLDGLERRQAKIRMPLFAQIIYPVLQREIESGNLRAIRVLLRYPACLNEYRRMHQYQQGYAEIVLIERYLQHDPQHDPESQDILLRKEALLAERLCHALHGLPGGVLYGMNGATIEQCEDLLGTLEAYIQTCHLLLLDRDHIIRYASMHFRAYRDYLLNRSLYTNYLDYIHQHRASKETTCLIQLVNLVYVVF